MGHAQSEQLAFCLYIRRQIQQAMKSDFILQKKKNFKGQAKGQYGMKDI